MIGKLFSYGGMLLLAGAALFATPGAGLAQGHGGHFSGGHFGGFHDGGYHGGSSHGYPSAYSYPHYGYHYYSPDYGYPYHQYDHSYYPYSSSLYPYVGSGPAVDLGYHSSYGGTALAYPDDATSGTPPASSYQTYYPPTAGTDQLDPHAHVTVQVPADAQVWFGDTLTSSTGASREFRSPPLAPGSRYTYDIRARWNENGHEVTQTQKVAVTAGAHVDVTFPVPSKTAG